MAAGTATLGMPPPSSVSIGEPVSLVVVVVGHSVGEVVAGVVVLPSGEVVVVVVVVGVVGVGKGGNVGSGPVVVVVVVVVVIVVAVVVLVSVGDVVVVPVPALMVTVTSMQASGLPVGDAVVTVVVVGNVPLVVGSVPVVAVVVVVGYGDVVCAPAGANRNPKTSPQKTREAMRMFLELEEAAMRKLQDGAS